MTKGEKPTAKGLALLADMLVKDFTPEQVALGIRCHLTESVFFPVFADIAKQLRDPAGEAWEAWRNILDHMKRQGYMTAPKLMPAAKNALDCVGGWMHLCEMQADQLNIMAAQFVRAYNAMQKREHVQKQIGTTSDAGRLLDISSRLLKPMP